MTDAIFRPALCKCVFKVNAKTFALQKVLFKCPMHAALTDEKCLGKVVEESQAITQIEKLVDETDEEYNDRRYLLADAQIKANSGA